jgi:hypothetical protein
MKLSMTQRQRLYGCIHDAVTKARVRLRNESGVMHGSLTDDIVARITEAAFRPFVDLPEPGTTKGKRKGKT